MTETNSHFNEYIAIRLDKNTNKLITIGKYILFNNAQNAINNNFIEIIPNIIMDKKELILKCYYEHNICPASDQLLKTFIYDMCLQDKLKRKLFLHYLYGDSFPYEWFTVPIDRFRYDDE